MLLDTPPSSERLIRTAIEHSDVVVVPTRAGALEVSRVRATLSMLAPEQPRGLVVVAARRHTRDYKDTLDGWRDAGVEVWATVPQRVAVCAGPDGPLVPDALSAYRRAVPTIMALR